MDSQFLENHCQFLPNGASPMKEVPYHAGDRRTKQGPEQTSPIRDFFGSEKPVSERIPERNPPGYGDLMALVDNCRLAEIIFSVVESSVQTGRIRLSWLGEQ
jgi:hypothetical protein